eukprot:2596058-Amphidinium_carterae.2
MQDWIKKPKEDVLLVDALAEKANKSDKKTEKSKKKWFDTYGPYYRTTTVEMCHWYACCSFV